MKGLIVALLLVCTFAVQAVPLSDLVSDVDTHSVTITEDFPWYYSHFEGLYGEELRLLRGDLDRGGVR